MIKTKYGAYDGDSWEEWCQLLLKKKYGDQGYQEMSSRTHGDLGIEGFTRTGIVFQCYCPDEEYDAVTLYDHQRDKVTKDLKKLSLYKKSLLDFFQNIKIKKWIFLTPLMVNKDITKHCHIKALEYREMTDLKELLHPDFDVLVHDEDFYSEEILTAKALLSNKILVDVSEPKEKEIIDWKSCDTEGVMNLSKKVNHVYPDKKIAERMIDVQIKNYLRGGKIIKYLENNLNELYEKKVRIKQSIAIHLEEEVLTSDNIPRELIKNIINQYKKALTDESFEELLEFGVTDNIAKEAIAHWLISCELDFGGVHDG